MSSSNQISIVVPFPSSDLSSSPGVLYTEYDPTKYTLRQIHICIQNRFVFLKKDVIRLKFGKGNEKTTTMPFKEDVDVL